MKAATKRRWSRPSVLRTKSSKKPMSSGTTASIFREVHGLLRRKKFESARKVLLSSQTGRVNTPYRSDLNHAWYIVGDIEFRLAHFKKAIRCFQNSLKHDNRDWMTYWAIADCYSEMNQPKKALAYYKHALRFVRANESLIYNIGNMYFDLKLYTQAIRTYRKITSADGDLMRMAQRNIQRALDASARSQ